MQVIGTLSSRTGNPVVEYFHGYVVKQMKLSLVNTKMMQLAGDFITVWFMKFIIGSAEALPILCARYFR